MSKTKGIIITLKAFLPIDKTDYDKQAEAYSTLAKMKRDGAPPDGFMSLVTILDITTKEGSADLPTVEGDGNDLANWPLSTDPLPEGAIVTEASTMLDLSIMQTVKLADSTETHRRISADQDAAERKANKAIPKPKAIAT